ncbi:hypothetical protein V5O48_016334, partial [Marasmius crinis-equi]
MASLFLDIEAQVALSSDKEPDFDGEDDFIDDNHQYNDNVGPAMSSSGVPAHVGDDVLPFLDDLERRCRA